MSIEILASKLPDVMGTYRRYHTQFSVAYFLVSTLLSKMFDVGDRDLPVLTSGNWVIKGWVIKWHVKLRTFFYVFFQNPKKHDFLRFLSGWPRFLEHWPWVPIKGSNTRVLSHSSLCVLFITTIKLRWRWIMMTAVIESDYVHYLSALTMWSDWLFLVLITFWQIIHCSLQTKTNKKCVLWQRNRTMSL